MIFVYNWSLFRLLLILSLLRLFVHNCAITRTNARGTASVWAGGTLLQSGYGAVFWMASRKPFSVWKALVLAGWWSQSPRPSVAGLGVQGRLLLVGRRLWRCGYLAIERAAAGVHDSRPLSHSIPSLSCRTSHSWPSRPSREGLGVGLQVRERGEA